MVDDGKTGLLFQSGDADGLAGQLKRVMDDDDLSIQLGSNAAGIARKRHWPERVAEETMEAYQQILERETSGIGRV